MKNDKELDNIFEECLERVLTGGETIEQCLASFPEHATELKPLLQTALAARETLEIAPRPEFRERARYQILTELRDMEERKQHRFSLFAWQPRWATAVIAVLVLLMASGGTVAAAGGSMPDQTLYPVKLVTENVRMALIPSKLGKAEYYAELVDKRVSEIVNMAEAGKLEHLEATTRRMNDQLMAMSVLVGTEEIAPVALTAPPAAPEDVLAPAETAVEAPAMLVAPQEPQPGVMMAPPLPEAAAEKSPPARAGEPQKGKPGIKATPARPIPEKAPVLAPTPAAVPEPVIEVAEEDEEEEEEDEKLDKRAKLRNVLAQYARKHPDALRAALQRAPESAKPALRRALEVSNIEYEKLLEFLEEEDVEAGAED